MESTPSYPISFTLTLKLSSHLRLGLPSGLFPPRFSYKILYEFFISVLRGTTSHPISILISSSHLRLGLPSGLFPSGFPTKILYAYLSSPILAFLISLL